MNEDGEIRIDRRVARTRALLQHALVSLILDRGYESITIKDICDHADVGRSTFYAHFTGKDDLKRSGLDHLRRLLAKRQSDAFASPKDTDGRTWAFCLPLFEHARDHIDLYRALIGGHGEPVAVDTIREIVSELVRRDLSSHGKNSLPNAVPREFVVQYAVGALMAVLTWWLDGGAKPTPEQVDAMFRQLTSEGLQPLWS